MPMLYLSGAAAAAVMLVTFWKSGSFVKNLFASAASGLAGLVLSQAAGLLGLTLVPLSLTSMLTAALLGLPGVVGLMLARVMVLNP